MYPHTRLKPFISIKGYSKVIAFHGNKALHVICRNTIRKKVNRSMTLPANILLNKIIYIIYAPKFIQLWQSTILNLKISKADSNHWSQTLEQKLTISAPPCRQDQASERISFSWSFATLAWDMKNCLRKWASNITTLAASLQRFKETRTFFFTKKERIKGVWGYLEWFWPANGRINKESIWIRLFSRSPLLHCYESITLTYVSLQNHTN